MNTFEIKPTLGAGWRAFKVRPWYLIGLSLAFIGIFIISIGNALITALAYIAYGGYLKMMIAHFRGEKIEFDDMFTLDSRWIYFAFLGIIQTFLIMLGLLLFIIPGIYLAVRWMFAPLLVIDQKMKPLESLKASSRMTEGCRWKLFFFMIIVDLIVLLSILFFVVGIFVAIVVAMFAIIKVYEDLKGKLNEKTETEIHDI